MSKRNIFAALALVAALPFASNATAATYDYVGAVTEATGTFAVLAPIGTPIAGQIDINSPGGVGTVTDTNDLTRILINLGGFCFNWNDTCTTGAEVPVTAITGINLTFDGSDFPVSGTIDLEAFSPTFGLTLPITLDIGNGTFISDNPLGIVAGEGNFVAAVPVPAAVWLFGTGLFALFGVGRKSA